MMMSSSSVFFAVVIAFILIAHPQTYRIVNGLSVQIGGPRIVNNLGGATTPGLLAHALVAALLALMILNFV